MVTWSTYKVTADDDAIRIDRWFSRYFPNISTATVQKHLRKGFIRLNDKKEKPGTKVKRHDVISIHPVVIDESKKMPSRPKDKTRKKKVITTDLNLQDYILYKDEWLIAINKPRGIPVQGGTGVSLSIDDLLFQLQFDKTETPKLIHRLDRDTSGVLLLARSTHAASKLAPLFKAKSIEKTYWALVVGTPKQQEGTINASIDKVLSDHGKEKVVSTSAGKHAVTEYEVVDKAGKMVSWLALRPITGRTHQLRVHCMLLGTPIVGDGKYGGRDAFIEGFKKYVHLHAREVQIPNYFNQSLTIKAALPNDMQESWDKLGFV